MSRTLLLADSNPAIQRIVGLTFAAEGMRVVSVGDGEEAVLRIADERPDIVLADIAMAKRNGYEVAAFVKGRPELAHIPVLLLAGALEPVDQALAAAARCDGVLVKPFDPQQVVARVQALFGGTSGNPAHVTAGMPRPIQRLVDVRLAPPFAAAPMPASLEAAPTVRADDPQADYFDRLDAAFGHLETDGGLDAVRQFESEAEAQAEDDTARLGVPTLSSLLDGPPTARPADPFQALIAADDADRQSRQAEAERTAAAAPAISEQLVDAVAARVIERLAPDGIDALVARIVSAMAERLVREEIDRIRGRK